MIRFGRLTRLRLLAIEGFAMVLMFGAADTSQAAASTRTSSAVSDIELAYRRDPRQVDSFRGVGIWAIGPSYSGATAQDSVEAQARALDAKGQPVNASLEWSVSDPDIVSVTPSQGSDVTIKILRTGDSELTITASGFSKQLLVHAETIGKLLVFGIAPPAPPKASSQAMDSPLKTTKQQVSYAAGMRLAKTLRAQSQDADPDLVAQAMKDVLAGGPTLMNDDQVQMALAPIETELNVTEVVLAKKRFAEQTKKEGEAFLAENAKKEGVLTLPSGLQYKVIKDGSGKKPGSLDVAVCQYTGRLIDGTVFDDSHRRKDGGPASFPVRGVIKGWQEALKLMPAGSEWQIFVPSDLAYGEHGVPKANIPPNAALVFDVELLSVREPSSSAPTSTAGSTPEQAVTPDIIEAIRKMVEKETEQKHNDN